MLKSLDILNHKNEIMKHEWSNYLYNTKEKKYNVLNVNSLKEINKHSVLNYVKRTLQILDDMKITKQDVLYYMEENIK